MQELSGLSPVPQKAGDRPHVKGALLIARVREPRGGGGGEA